MKYRFLRFAPGGSFLKNVAPAVIYVAAVFYLGSLPHAQVPEVASADKLVHLLAFVGMQVVLLRAIRHELPRLTYKWQLLWAVLLASLVGGALELYQAALPYRSAELGDWAADTAGALLAAAGAWPVLRSKANRSARPEVLQRDSEPQAG